MKIYLIEKENNLDIYNYLLNKGHDMIDNLYKKQQCQALIVSKVQNIKQALDIVDTALQLGVEVICIRNMGYTNFTCNLLIREGAICI